MKTFLAFVLAGILILMAGCTAADPYTEDAYYHDLYTHNIAIGDAFTAYTLTLNGVALGGGGLEIDPIFTASPAFGITALDIAAWNASVGDMTKAVYDPANIGEQLVGLTAGQSLTNKQLTMNNGDPIKWETFAGVPQDTINLLASDILQITNASGAIQLLGGGINLNFNVDEDIYLWGGTKGTGRELVLYSGYAVALGTLRDSPTLDMAASYWDGGAAVGWSGTILHDMITAGAAPKSQLKFSINSVSIFRLENDNGTVKLFADGALDVASTLSITGSNNELRFYEGVNYVGFEAPALGDDQIWVLPDDDGIANDVLTTDGAGNLSWAAGGGGGGMINPMTTLGDIIYEDASPAPNRLAGDTSDTRKFLRSLSAGGVATAPVWDTVTKTDVGLANVTNDAQITKSLLTEQGDIIYASGVATPAALAHGTSTQYLKSGGHGANPAWASIADGDLPAALTGKSYNGLTLTATTGTFTLTNLKTLSVSDTTTLATNSITLGGGEVITFTAGNALTLTTTGATSVTLPTAGTLLSGNIFDAKGDLLSASADNTPALLAVGTVNGQMLVVDNTTATGLKWVEPFHMLMTTANQTINSGAGTYVDITNLTFPVVSGSTYAFKFYIVFQSAATTTGYKASVNCPTGTLDFFCTNQTIANSSTVGVATWLQRHSVTRDDMTTLTATITANVDLVVIIEGRYISTQNGTFAARFANELAANNDLTVRAGSWGYYFVNGAGAK